MNRPTIDVFWLTLYEHIPARGYWDGGFLDALLNGQIWSPVNGVEYRHFTNIGYIPIQDFGIVFFPANAHKERIAELNQQLAHLQRCIVILGQDEDSSFPYKELRHPNMTLLVAYPRPDVHLGVWPINCFWADGTDKILEKTAIAEQNNDLFFAGQINHNRRQMAASAIQELPPSISGEYLPTQGFSQGLERSEYLHRMRQAKVAPCPAGQVSADSFRVFEALECGCVPIVDGQAPVEGYQEGYWEMTLGTYPFPMLTDWGRLRQTIMPILQDYPKTNNRVFAWWQQYKRNFAYKFENAVRSFESLPLIPEAKTEITILITTSPIPSHPSTEIIEQTIASIRERLPDCEILIGIDGVRPEQSHRDKDYQEYVRRLLWLTGHHYKNIVPFVFGEHLHQAGMTRELLKEVKTPLILFIEHDTPLIGKIPFLALFLSLRHDGLNLIRLHYDASIHPEHQYLMCGEYDNGYANFTKTVQWSQRPHLATTSFYQSILEKFPEDSRTMIEDFIYSKIVSAPWEEYKLTIYTPKGDIKRSINLDGRGDDPKFEMKY